MRGNARGAGVGDNHVRTGPHWGVAGSHPYCSKPFKSTHFECIKEMEIWTILRNYLRLLERDIAFERSQWIRTDAAWWLVVNHAMVQYLAIGPRI